MKNRKEKYLHKYADTHYKIETEKKECKYAVVVPAIAEYDNLSHFLESFNNQDKTYFNDTLLLFVINNSVNSQPEVKEDNQKSILLLREIIRGIHVYSPGIQIGYIDAASEGKAFPEKFAGVGLARKTGMDAVLKLFGDYNGIIICTDADCTFEKDYLTEVINYFREENTSAAVINFKHNTNDESTADAVINYEIFLRYYVVGLNYSKSPYAFHTIGSSMACTAKAYMKVEGMNKKKAAEDFYFIEKLAKQYPIKKVKTTAVYPSSRKSWRVPFGTGQRVNRFLTDVKDEYTLYHPDTFKVLAEWHKVFFNSDILSGSEYLVSAKGICMVLYDYLVSLDFEKDWNSIMKNSGNNNLLKQKIQWFDGFRTLKLIHFLRDKKYGAVPMFEALDEMFLMHSLQPQIFRTDLIPDRTTQLKYLEILREIDN